MRILLSGDIHGNYNALAYKIRQAKSANCEMVIVLGDLGLWPGLAGMQFIDWVNAEAIKQNIDVLAIPGNHEWYPKWEEVTTGPNKVKRNSSMFHLRSNILLTPQMTSFTLANKKFFVAGGAVSIDRQYRAEGKAWWPQERLPESKVDNLERSYNGGPVDYLLTHDCSNKTPFGSRLKPYPDSQEHRRLIDRVINTVKPRTHFHGHMHTWYEWDNHHADGWVTNTYGLEDEMNPHSTLLLDTESDTIYKYKLM